VLPVRRLVLIFFFLLELLSQTRPRAGVLAVLCCGRHIILFAPASVAREKQRAWATRRMHATSARRTCGKAGLKQRRGHIPHRHTEKILTEKL